MALKRPAGREPQFEVPDAKFVDEMVRASLAVNPNLKHGASTNTFLAKLREQAMSGGAPSPSSSSAGGGKAAASDAPASIDDKRKQTIRLFLDLKSDDLDRELGVLEQQRAAIEAQEAALKQRAAEEIVDHLMVVNAAGADLSLAKEVLREFKALLARLGVTDNDLLRQAHRRK